MGYGLNISHQAKSTHKKKVMGVLDIYGFEIFEVSGKYSSKFMILRWSIFPE